MQNDKPLGPLTKNQALSVGGGMGAAGILTLLLTIFSTKSDSSKLEMQVNRNSMEIEKIKLSIKDEFKASRRHTEKQIDRIRETFRDFNQLQWTKDDHRNYENLKDKEKEIYRKQIDFRFKRLEKELEQARE